MDKFKEVYIPNPKSYLVHIYYQMTYIETKLFETQKDLKSFLRKSNVSFGNYIFLKLEDDSIMLSQDDFSYEIEESLISSKSIDINGTKYISISDFCKRTNTPLYKAKYDLSLGKINGLWVGRNHLRYIQESEVYKYDRDNNPS